MKKADSILVICIIFLTLFGLIMMSSMSVASSYRVSLELFGEPSNNYFFIRHLQYIIISIIPLYIGYKMPYEYLKKLAPIAFIGGISLLLITYFMGDDNNTRATSWLSIGGIISLQPVEFVKIAIIIFMAAMLHSKKIVVQSFLHGFLPYSIALSIPCILLALQPDFGSIALIGGFTMAMFFSAGGSVISLLIGGGVGISLLLFMVYALKFNYIIDRLHTFISPEQGSDAAYQIEQASIAIGSGGIFGRGFQNSIQKFDYLPEVYSDTIFAAIAEEMGFIRILLLLIIYCIILHRGLFIARFAPDDFTRYLAVGLTVSIVGQAFLNIAVNLSLFPNTGITLPLLSYGGSSLMATALSMGILLHISENLKAQKRYIV